MFWFSFLEDGRPADKAVTLVLPHYNETTWIVNNPIGVPVESLTLREYPDDEITTFHGPTADEDSA